MTISLDDVQALATQLAPSDQLRLIERLAAHLAGEPRPPTLPDADWEERWDALRDDLATLPAQRLASEQLEADRAERQTTLEGHNARP